MLANSRINPKPFEVVPLNFTDVQDWKRYSDEFIPSSTKISDHIFKLVIHIGMIQL